MTSAGFPHSEILESQPGCRLLEAYRRLQRPSSAPGAKTSTVCSYKLDTACTTCKLLQKRIPLTRNPFAEDARVHCVVLKIRTEPYGANPHPRIYAVRPFKVSSPKRSGCFLRTQQRAHSALRSMRSFRELTEARSVLTALSRAS